MLELFKQGIIDYSDRGFDKPVKISDNDLKRIASSLSTTNLTKEHTEEVIGELNNFMVEDGILKVNKPSIDLGGYGLSPVFDCDGYIDRGDYLEPHNLVLVNVGLVENPRNGILYNSKGDEKMSDNLREIIDSKDERITEQQEEIALLKKQVSDLQDVANQKNNIDKELKAKLKELEESNTRLDEYKHDAERLREQEANNKAQLIKDIAGDDEKAQTYLSKLSCDELEDMKNKTIVTQPKKGADATNSNPDDDGDTDDSEPEVDIYSEEYFLKWDEQNSRY